MKPRVIAVRAGSGATLTITFSNGEIRRFDAAPYLGYPAFESLREPVYFARARAEAGTVTWPNGVDVCPDTLYLESELCGHAGRVA